MAIVTVSHAAFTGGSAIAEQVAAALNYRSVNREVLIEASQRYGIPEAKFQEVLETQGHWWERSSGARAVSGNQACSKGAYRCFNGLPD
jgi:hypothetical protein